MTDAEKQTEEEVAWNEKVDEYIATLHGKWSDDTPAEVRGLVVGNIRGFAGWIRAEMMQ